jgi:hypothetical protein
MSHAEGAEVAENYCFSLLPLLPLREIFFSATYYHETSGCFHVFMGATFMPEARRVFRQVAEDLG